MPQPAARPLHDPRMLRALAHPVRSRILNELTAQGSLRAADVADELGIPANQASFHLRQLAKYGLIEEDPDAAHDRRDRVWRPVAAEGYEVAIRSLEKQPGGKAAGAAFRRSARDWGHAIIDSVAAGERDKNSYTSLTDVPLRLTQDEAAAFAGELNDLADRWRRRTTGKDPQRRTYIYLGVLAPHPAPR